MVGWQAVGWAAALGMVGVGGATVAGCIENPPDSNFRCVVADGGDEAPPKPIYLFFADGRTPVPNGRGCAGASTPPAYTCRFPLDGDPASCASQVQGFLDRFFAAYNVFFTRTPPATEPFDTVVVTSDNAWCHSTDRGATPLSCSHRPSDAAFALRCDDDPKDCAVLIAHEYGHLVGLAHTKSPTDIMYQTPCTLCDGFRNADIGVPGNSCGRTTQNSNQLLCNALGARSSAQAPVDAVRCTDLGPPRLTVTAPREGDTITDSAVVVTATAADECGVRKVTARVTSLSEGEATGLFPPYRLALSAPAGLAEVLVTAVDNSGLTTSTTVHVRIVVTPRDAAPPD